VPAGLVLYDNDRRFTGAFDQPVGSHRRNPIKSSRAKPRLAEKTEAAAAG
jgi:hypothetical protein